MDTDIDMTDRVETSSSESSESPLRRDSGSSSDTEILDAQIEELEHKMEEAGDVVVALVWYGS